MQHAVDDSQDNDHRNNIVPYALVREDILDKRNSFEHALHVDPAAVGKDQSGNIKRQDDR